MNMGRNKSHVAIRKILEHHPNILADMNPFFADWIFDDEQSLKALPHVINWLNKAAKAVKSPGHYYKNIQQKKLSAIYQFARAMPLMFVTNIDVKYIVQVQENDNTIEAKLPQQSKDMIRGVASDKCCVIQ